MNLLSNAVKFTPPGGSVELSASGDEEAGEVRLEVRDTGPGIAPEDLPKLFQPFTQLDTRLAREHAGTGLGLALVRSLAELHGGRADVESEPGKGSRFRVALPWRRPAPRGSGVHAAAREDRGAGGASRDQGPNPPRRGRRREPDDLRGVLQDARLLRRRGLERARGARPARPRRRTTSSSSTFSSPAWTVSRSSPVSGPRAEPDPARSRPHRARHGRGPGANPRRGCGRLPLQARTPRRPREGDRPAAGDEAVLRAVDRRGERPGDEDDAGSPSCSSLALVAGCVLPHRRPSKRSGRRWRSRRRAT